MKRANLKDSAPAKAISFEVSSLVQLCADRGIEIAGQTLVPDKCRAYVECHLSHAFPVTTSDGTALHPQVVANSHRSMLHQVFNFNHLMRSYDPEEIPRDRILGSVAAVEFPNTPIGGWKVQGKRASAPGIRAVCVMHKAAETADRILGSQHSGRRRWTVSMEVLFQFVNSGFLVKDQEGELRKEWETPKDLAELGWTYIPAVSAPDDLLECWDEEKVKIKRAWKDGATTRDVLLLEGGLNGQVQYSGIGLTLLGKEPEAEVTQMVASGRSGSLMEDESAMIPGEKILQPLADLLALGQSMVAGKQGRMFAPNVRVAQNDPASAESRA